MNSLEFLASSICFNNLDDILKYDIISKWIKLQDIDLDVDLNKLNNIFIEFIISNENKVILTDLNNTERKYLHNLCSESGLRSKSKCCNKDRILRLTKSSNWRFDPTKKYKNHYKIHFNKVKTHTCISGKIINKFDENYNFIVDFENDLKELKDNNTKCDYCKQILTIDLVLNNNLSMCFNLHTGIQRCSDCDIFSPYKEEWYFYDEDIEKYKKLVNS